MKSTTNVISFSSKLSASMKFCQTNFNCTFVFWLMNSRWNSSSIINNSATAIFEQKHFNRIAISCKRFINTIVNNFCYQMMKSSFVSASYIHSRSFSNRFKPFQNLNITCFIVIRFFKILKFLFLLFHFFSHKKLLYIIYNTYYIIYIAKIKVFLKEIYDF